MFEQWASVDGIWRESAFFLTLTSEKRNKKRGARAWLTQSEIAQRYGSADVAQAIVDAKIADDKLRELHVRVHPDCPEPLQHGEGSGGVTCPVRRSAQDLLQYFVWVQDEEATEEDDVVKQLFQACDRSRSPSRSKKSKKDKRKKSSKRRSKKGKKRSRSSSDSSSGTGSRTASGSSSEATS